MCGDEKRNFRSIVVLYYYSFTITCITFGNMLLCRECEQINVHIRSLYCENVIYVPRYFRCMENKLISTCLSGIN